MRYARRQSQLHRDPASREFRAKDFGDVVFMDHCEIKHMGKKHQLFLVLDGATSLLWGATQQEGTEPVTQDLFREWMHIHSCKPKWVVADMVFFTPSWMTFWKTHGVKTMPTGRATPWPNRAETAVRLFKSTRDSVASIGHLLLQEIFSVCFFLLRPSLQHILTRKHFSNIGEKTIDNANI